MESLIGRSLDITAIREQRKKRLVFIAAVLACTVACMGIFYLLYQWFINREYTSYSVVKTISVKNGSSLDYMPYDGGVLRYGRDGVTATDSGGDTVWSGSYEMADPKIDVCEASAVVADVGGKSLYVYKGGEGTGLEFSVDYPIVQACVSKQGVVAVLTEETSSNTISLYNPFDNTQKLLAEIPTNVEDGYPVSIDLSPDGSSVVASYLCVTTGAAQSRVAFYNFSEVGKNANCLVGAQNYNDSLISEVCFLDDSNVCLFGEKGFYLWNNMKQPVQTAKKEFDSGIRSAFFSEDYVGVVLEQDDQCKMEIYTEKGKKKTSVSVDAEYNWVQMYGDEILFYSATKCQVYRINGVKKLDTSPNGKISSFFASGKMNRYFFVQNSRIKMIKLE